VNRILVSVLILVFLLSGCSTTATEVVEIRDAWARPAVQGGNGAIYLVIRSSEPDELVGASSDIADAVEIHESTMSEDVMEMHQLEFVPLEPGEDVTFKPGGLHIMLIGLRQDLKNGDRIEITLHFSRYQDIRVSVPVQDIPASEDNHSSSTY